MLMENTNTRRYFIISQSKKINKRGANGELIRSFEETNAVTVYDAVENTVVFDVDINKIKSVPILVNDLKDFDMTVKKYNKDTDVLNNTIGTAVYVNTQNNFYGVISSTRDKRTVTISWISKENFEKNTFNVANMNGPFININDKGEQIIKFTKENNGPGKFKIRNQCVKCIGVPGANFSAKISAQQFKESVGFYSTQAVVKNAVDNDNVIDANNDIEKTTENIDTNIQDVDSVNKEYNNCVVNNSDIAYGNIDNIQCDVDDNNRNTDAESIDLESSNDNAKEINIDVSSVNSSAVDIIKDTSINVASDFLYDTILKVLNVHDTITVPIEYCARRHLVVNEICESNINGSNYTSITTVKFSENSEMNICAIVNVNESAGKARITILKPYNETKFTDEEIKVAKMKYDDLRVKTSYYKVGD